MNLYVESKSEHSQQAKNNIYLRLVEVCSSQPSLELCNCHWPVRLLFVQNPIGRNWNYIPQDADQSCCGASGCGSMYLPDLEVLLKHCTSDSQSVVSLHTCSILHLSCTPSYPACVVLGDQTCSPHCLHCFPECA